jgi:hypothetical protein
MKWLERIETTQITQDCFLIWSSATVHGLQVSQQATPPF